MQCPRCFGEKEIMGKAAVAQHSLRPDSGDGRLKILDREARTIFAAFLEIGPLRKRVSEFSQSRSPMRTNGAPGSGKATKEATSRASKENF